MTWRSTPSVKTIADLIIEALAKVYEARVFMHVDKIQQHPEIKVGVDFPNIIRLIKAGQHYDLLKQGKEGIVIAHKGRYFFYVDIRMHRKPKMPRDDKNNLRTQIDKYRGWLLMQFIIKLE